VASELYCALKMAAERENENRGVGQEFPCDEESEEGD